MDRHQIVEILDTAEASVADGSGLAGTGFWEAVSQVRRDGSLVDEFAERIASIDRRAFEAGVKLRVPAPVGTAALGTLTAAGAAALWVAGGIDSRFLRTVVFGAAVGTLLVSTHSLAHWAVGRAFGMRFTHYFLGGPPPPRPGAKLDYSTYLPVHPRQRAMMHASGAVVTKVLPFAAIPAARALDLYGWVTAILVVLGVGQVITDALFSVKSSDWKKVRRELKAARAWTAPG